LAGGCNTGHINYGDLPQDYLPPTKWEEISSTRIDPGDWITVNVNGHGLPANDSTIDADTLPEKI